MINRITQAQNISHIINCKFPHISPYRNVISIKKIVRNGKNIDHHDKLIKIINWHNSLSNKLKSIRNKYIKNQNTNIEDIFYQLKTNKLGNCYENAVIAAVLCKLQGINAYVANITKDEKNLDHVICVFNKSGKPVDKIINNDTIILDPWIDIVDYANNYFTKNNYLLDEIIFDIPKKGKFNIRVKNNLKTSIEENKELKKYNQLFLKA